MNKKLHRLMQPNMLLYFAVMVLFAVAALVLGQYYLAVGEAAVTLLLLLFYQWTGTRRRRRKA